MLRGNLSTRPFYNDRVVTLVLAAIGVLVVLLTVLNVTQLLSLSARWTDIQGRLTTTRGEAAAIRAQAAAEQQTADRGTFVQLAASADEANRLIEQRTFSWTALFGLLERAMPTDVRLVSVSPRVDSSGLTVDMAIAARGLIDVDMFVTALQDSGAFYDVTPSVTQAGDDGTVSAIVMASYLAPEERGGAKDGVAGSKDPATDGRAHLAAASEGRP
jgi:hypothetical protein